MTTRCFLASNEDQRSFLRSGIRSMFVAGSIRRETAPPVDTESDRKALPVQTPQTN